jgi:hypothetical protein
MPSVATAIDVARLYDELRDCVRANDQDGVKRVFNELVRARRPVTEILDEVRSISKERERSEPERDVTPLREWPPRSPSAEAEPSTPGLTFRNFGPAAAPEPAPEPPDAAGSATSPAAERGHWPLDKLPQRNAAAEPPPRAPEPASPSPDRAIDPSFGLEDSDNAPVTAEPGPEEAVSSLNEGPQYADRSAVQPTTPEPIDQSIEPPIAPGVAFEHSDAAAVVAGLQPEQNGVSLGEGPTPPHLEEAAPDPAYQSFDGTPSSQPGGAPATTSGPGRDDARFDQATQASLPTAVEEDTPDAAQHISSRAVSLGVELDAAPGAVDTAPPARRAPWARLGVALVFLIAIAGGGWFMLIRPPAEQVAVKPIPSSESVATAAGPTGSTGAAPAGQPVAAAVATPPTTERAPEIAAPPPAAIPAARLPATAPPAPGDIVTTKPDATSAVAKLEMPKSAPPSASASPDIPSPATAPTVVAPPAPTPPSEPRASTAETAALLARGDSLFGVGDVSSARLFYERAADAGNGDAALRLGETYDPVFLERAKLPAVRGDRGAAVFWYRRARELGVAEAEILLKGIQTK